jgi:hypothetical protein
MIAKIKRGMREKKNFKSNQYTYKFKPMHIQICGS